MKFIQRSHIARDSKNSTSKQSTFTCFLCISIFRLFSPSSCFYSCPSFRTWRWSFCSNNRPSLGRLLLMRHFFGIYFLCIYFFLYRFLCRFWRIRWFQRLRNRFHILTGLLQSLNLNNLIFGLHICPIWLVLNQSISFQQFLFNFIFHSWPTACLTCI